MGGPNGAFGPTHWREILSVQTTDEGRRRQALEQIITRYWKPVYCYLRRKGHGNEEAKDLTQGFFHEMGLRRDLFQKADRSKGRFRNLLLTALNRYASNARRNASTKRRSPAGGLVRLEAMDAAQLPEPARDARPEDAFYYAWASELLDHVLAAVEADCRQSGKSVHWEVFRARVIAPIVEGESPPSLPELCARYHIGDEAKASNMIITVKRRFRSALTAHIRDVVDSDDDVDGEIQELMQILARRGAGSAGKP